MTTEPGQRPKRKIGDVELRDQPGRVTSDSPTGSNLVGGGNPNPYTVYTLENFFPVLGPLDEALRYVEPALDAFFAGDEDAFLLAYGWVSFNTLFAVADFVTIGGAELARVAIFAEAKQIVRAGVQPVVAASREGWTAVRGGVTATTEAGRQVGHFRLTETVARHADDIVTKGPFKGEPARPYLSSPNTIEPIMQSGPGIPDPGGVPGALRWDIPGSFRGSQGTWELVVGKANEVLHFNFVR